MNNPKLEATKMTFEINFNFRTKTWNVWKITRNLAGETISAEVVKRFKSKRAAENWVAKQ